jgi:hypothetical protein
LPPFFSSTITVKCSSHPHMLRASPPRSARGLNKSVPPPVVAPEFTPWLSDELGITPASALVRPYTDAHLRHDRCHNRTIAISILLLLNQPSSSAINTHTACRRPSQQHINHCIPFITHADSIIYIVNVSSFNIIIKLLSLSRLRCCCELGFIIQAPTREKYITGAGD